MKEEEIPDKNIFMMCEALNCNALTELSANYSVRSCRPDELGIWQAMPFDDADLAKSYEGFMSDYFATTYSGREELFFAETLFVCDRQNKPVATCLVWKAYNEFNTIQWFKVLKESSRQEEAGSHRYSTDTPRFLAVSLTGTPPAKSLLADSNLLSVIFRFRPQRSSHLQTSPSPPHRQLPSPPN